MKQHLLKMTGIWEGVTSCGLIERSESQFFSPCLLVKKKDGKTRFVQDYHKVNDMTVQDAYPQPRLDDSPEALGGAKLFSLADLLSGYWQLGKTERAKQISTFVTCTKSGLYSPRVMTMGLCGASHTFQRPMETVMRGLQSD